MPRPLVMRPELHTVTTAALVFILGAVAPSCAADPVPVRDCTPGASLACACVGGSTGAQLCDGAGHLGACVCPDAATVDRGDGSADGPELAPDGAAVDGAGIDAASADAPDVFQGIDVGGPCLSLLFYCNGRCVDVRTDPMNCGGCGMGCGGNLLCVPDGPGGRCVAPDAGADVLDAVDAAPADAGPVTYDLDARAPGSLRWRMVARTSRGDCDVTGNTSTGYTCTSDAWRVTVTCPGADAGTEGPVQFIGERGDAGWSVTLAEPGGARETASRVAVEARPDDSGGFVMHARFTVPAGTTRGATGIPGRTVAVDTADAWLFGCVLGL